MFDVAYTVEASIDAAEIEYNKTWSKIASLDLKKQFAGYIEMLYLSRLCLIKKYWLIMYGTHGG